MKAKQGFILINTGAPNSTQEVDQRRYLKEVSRDRHVTDLPAVLDTAVHPHRATRSSAAYKAVWTTEGSPLVSTCKRIRNALRERQDAPVEIGMLYGSPSVMRGIGKLLDAQVEEIGVLPLFPQYSTETYQACIDKVAAELRKRKCGIVLKVIPPYYDHPAYITPLAQKVEGVTAHILFNYRGLSLQHLKQPDKHGHCMSSMTCCCEASAAHNTCYRFQCLKTTQLIAKAAGLPDAGYSVSFDCHHGPVKGIEPYTEDLLRRLPKQGHRQLVVISPSYFCDSVETLKEIRIRGKKIFADAGGDSYRMVHGLNDGEEGIQCLHHLIRDASHWPAC